MRERTLLYLASPLFSASERVLNEEIVTALEKWCDVFLPQRDGKLIPKLVERGISPGEAYKDVFDLDIHALNACDALVVNLDGRSVDEGAAFELGYAYALGKMCVGFHTDVRVLLPWGLNPMVVMPLAQIFDRLDELEKWARSYGAQSKFPISLETA